MHLCLSACNMHNLPLSTHTLHPQGTTQCGCSSGSTHQQQYPRVLQDRPRARYALLLACMPPSVTAAAYAFTYACSESQWQLHPRCTASHHHQTLQYKTAQLL